MVELERGGGPAVLFTPRHFVTDTPRRAPELPLPAGAAGVPHPPPLLTAAVRCLAEPKMYIRNKAMSTGPHAPLVLVNGPKGRVANVNSGMCALGPGAPPAPNAALGRGRRPRRTE